MQIFSALLKLHTFIYVYSATVEAEMAIETQCPGCKKAITLPDTSAGKKARCNSCNTIFEIPFVVEEEHVEAHAPGADDDDELKLSMPEAPKRAPAPAPVAAAPAPAGGSWAPPPVAPKAAPDGSWAMSSKGSPNSSREKPLGAGWIALVWVLGGGCIGLIVSVAMYFSWKKDQPNRARAILKHGIIAMVVLNVLFIGAFMALVIPAARVAKMRINELVAMQACVTFCSAEDVYRRNDWNGDGVLEYAQTLNDLKEQQLVSRPFAGAEYAENHTNPTAFKGYLYRVMHKQGPSAQRGARLYINNGHMVNGYALLAVPEVYGVSGKYCYIISMVGNVFRKDFERQVEPLEFETFEPQGWELVEPKGGGAGEQ